MSINKLDGINFPVFSENINTIKTASDPIIEGNIFEFNNREELSDIFQKQSWGDLEKTTSNEIEDLSAELEEIKEEQGFIGKLWDGFKNLTHIGAGSNKAEDKIKQYKNGEISYDEAKEAIEKYKAGQEMAVDVAADMASGIIAVGAFVAAVPTGGASLAAGLGLATAAGAGVKIGVKAGDAMAGGRDYTGKDLLYDAATGAINGVMAPVTNGIGASVTKTIGKKLGLTVVKEGTEEVIEQAAKQGIKSVITQQGVDVIGGTLTKRAAATAAGMAVDGALGGAADNMVRAALNGENVLEAGVQGAVGGLIMSPIIGGGFKVAGKAGRALNNKITTKNLFEQGMETTFKQGETGDCALLSMLDGMMNNTETQNKIKKSITKSIGGDYHVNIGGKSITVPKSALTDEMLSDTSGIKIFEAAYRQLDNIEGGFAENVAKQFGLNPIHIASESITDETLDKIANESGSVLSLGTFIENADGARTRHYFSIKGVDPNTKTVTVADPYNSGKLIQLSYDDVKTGGISIDGGTIRETSLPTSQRTDDMLFFGKKKKPAVSSEIVKAEDVSIKDELKKKYLKISGYDLAEMEEALGCIDEELAERIRKTGDLFTLDEISAIEGLVSVNNGLYDIDEIIRCRGSIARLSASNMVDRAAKTNALANDLKKYVRNYSDFIGQDEASLAKSIYGIDCLIDEFGDTRPYPMLHRGVMKDSEIARMFSLLDYKLAHPDETVIYTPMRLTSTTSAPDMLDKTLAEKCSMQIEIPKDRADDAVKMLDVNGTFKKFNLGENQFSFQEEFLMPSNVAFEIKGMRIKEDGTPLFIVSLYN